jgi:hypothetical protein
MEILTDPTVFGALKIVGIAILFVMGIPFLVGIAIGWFVRGMTS